jgi:hypothetical protein
VIAATVVTAFQVPAVLAEPVPEGGPAGRDQRVRADTDHPAAAVGADLAILEEEVHAVTRPIHRAGAVTQHARSAYAPRQLTLCRSGIGFWVVSCVFLKLRRLACTR